MNFEAYWQENRTFVLRVAAGAVLFLIGSMVVSGTVGSELVAKRSALTSAQRRLAQPAHTAADEQAAREDHTRLGALLAELEQRVDFAPRGGYRPIAAPATTARYLNAVAAVREELLPLARRRGMALDPALGLPEQSPTREDELGRYLDGLDVVERAARLALDEQVERIDTLRIRLDPSLFGRDGAGYVERTSIELSMSGKSAPLLAFLQRTQRAGPRPLIVERATLEASRQRADEARLELVLLAPRVARSTPSEEARP